MERREEDLEGEFYLQGLDKAFTILHDAPAVPISRQQKTKKDQKPTAQEISRKKLLEHHSALYQGEPDEFRLLRADAMQSCWEELSSRIQATLEGTDQQVFCSLLSFAKENHKTPRILAHTSQNGYNRVPTALVLAGGVNSADHAETFPHLVKFMKDQGLYVALLQPHSFGRTVGDALNEMLCQFSGMDTQAQHAEALIAWYYDEVGHPSAAAEMEAHALPRTVTSSSPAASPAGMEGRGRGGSKKQQKQEGDEEQEAGRQLRHRRGAGEGQGGSGVGVSAAQKGKWEKPLVVVVEGTESLDAGCLRDVMLTLSECGGQIPITVLLGLTTAEGALHEMLSSEVTDRCMDCKSFKLASAMTRMNRLVSNVLLGNQGGWPGLLFDAGVISALVSKFYIHYYSTSIMKHGLQLVALEHFRTQPASFLAASSLQNPQDSLRTACANLPAAVAAEVKKAADGKGGAKAADTYLEFLNCWYRWAVAVHWLVAAARCAGLPGSRWQYVQVLEDALSPNFASTSTREGLKDLDRLLRKMLPEQVRHLAGELQAAVRQVEGAEAVLAAEVQQLQEIAREASRPAQQQQEEGQGQEGNPVDARGSDSLDAARGSGGQQAEQSEGREAAEAGKHAQQGQQGQGGVLQKAAARKREVYHSNASRRKALLEKASQVAAASKSVTVKELEKKAQEAAAPGAKLASWLLDVLGRTLATPPTRLPGAAPFTCRSVSAVESLSGSFRQVIHAGLTQPHLFLSGLREQVGIDSQMDDACLAYMLFDQDPNCANVADWFQAFCDVHLGPQEEAEGGKKGKKAAVKGKRKKGGAEEEGAKSKGAERKEKMTELAARFTQATSELQLVGLIKPAKRRRGDFVQRLVHMPAEAD